MDLAEYAQIYLNISIRGMRITKIIHPKVTRNGINFEYYFPRVCGRTGGVIICIAPIQLAVGIIKVGGGPSGGGDVFDDNSPTMIAVANE